MENLEDIRNRLQDAATNIHSDEYIGIDGIGDCVYDVLDYIEYGICPNDDFLRMAAKAIYNTINIGVDVVKNRNTAFEIMVKHFDDCEARKENGFNIIHNDIYSKRLLSLIGFLLDLFPSGDFELCLNVSDACYRRFYPQKHGYNELNIELTERERKYYAKAVESGMAKKTEGGYKWLYNNNSKASLAYFLYKLFNPNGTGQIPYQRLDELWGVTRLDSALTQMLNAKEASTMENTDR